MVGLNASAKSHSAGGQFFPGDGGYPDNYGTLNCPYDPEAQNIIYLKFQGPSLAHWFGTDQLGRGVFSRILYGGRVTILIPADDVCNHCNPGTVLGVLTGYFRGWVDDMIMRICDIMLSFLARVLIPGVGIMGTGLTNIVVAMVIANGPGMSG